ncbi:MAG: hypothetical protein DSY66_01770 [Persephonella sp.]|nr:MAG: hypothetical protein DSY66_01770 [Persephonella sp.]
MDKILITREYEDSKRLRDRLKALGYFPIIFPTIKTVPLEFNTENMTDYDVYIFGSRKGVKYFFEKIKDLNSFKDKKFIAVGEKTASELRKLGFSDVLIPDEYNSLGVLKLIKDNWQYFKDKKIIFPKSKIGVDLLEKNLPNVKPIYVYNTVFNKPDNIRNVEDLLKRKEISITIFTSPSTFLGFKNIFKYNWKNYLENTNIISIGKTTYKKLKKENLNKIFIPEKATEEEIIKLIEKISLS